VKLENLEINKKKEDIKKNKENILRVIYFMSSLYLLRLIF